MSHRLASVIALIALSVSAFTGCHQATGMQALLGPRARTPAPASDGACRLDLSGEKADTVFFLLGFLQSRRNVMEGEDFDAISGFYRNQGEASRVFRRYVDKFAVEQGLDPVIREETTDDGPTSYHSRVIAQALNSCYQYEMTDQILAQGEDGTYRRTAFASLNGALFYSTPPTTSFSSLVPPRRSYYSLTELSNAFQRRRALAYLAGSWVRNGHGKDFVFTGVPDEARFVASLLFSLECFPVSIESSVGLIPGGHAVHFKPTPEVEEWLNRVW